MMLDSAKLSLLDLFPETEALRATHLGCGGGDHTRLLLELWAEAEVWGLVGSREILEHPKVALYKHPPSTMHSAAAAIEASRLSPKRGFLSI